ncbi:MAG TPA: alkaline phosphatase family protein [Chitinophagales bacterium]|nr:alkaline phosphatase family protein [Chitinophagales bacterium]
MKKQLIFTAFLFSFIFSFSQTTKPIAQNARPKLVVGIVVDQMRWDFLYRYYDRYSKGGFKRLMNDGFNCENTFIPYTPTVTAAGHTCIYTGSVPAIHGIVGNGWYDYTEKRDMYCSEDKSVQTVGANNDNGKMSPKNMLTTTICDELKLATNFRSKVIGVAIKDRGAILPAGHSADAAYWYDSKTGSFISSTYYFKELPKWTQDFNASNKTNSYYEKNWNTLYPINTYLQSDVDTNNYESTVLGDNQKGFPYDLKRFIDKKDFGKIRSTPYGNSLTFDFAKAALINEQLGKDSITDFLAVSFSSTDYIGHAFGPNSVEIEDTYLRLDKDLEAFLIFLDNQVGKNNYTLFLSADHGVAHVPGFLAKHKIPNGGVVGSESEKKLNAFLKEKFSVDSLCLGSGNYQFYLNHNLIEEKKLDYDAILESTISFLQKIDGVDRALEYADLQEAMLPKALKEQFTNGYYPSRCGDVLVILKPGYIDDEYDSKGTTHGIWNPYDAHIPLLFFGNGIAKGKEYNKTYMTDIAPTLASLLHIQMPSGCIGNVVKEAIKK